MQVSDIKPGFWGLSRIYKDSGGIFTTCASEQKAADNVQNYYSPVDSGAGEYPVDFALVRFVGKIKPMNGDTVLLPVPVPIIGDVSLDRLSQEQRNNIAKFLSRIFPQYGYVDYDGKNINKKPFRKIIDNYPRSATLKGLIRDIYSYLGHSKWRYRDPVIETHNTLYTDNFGSDPSSNWTVYGSSSYSWDSVNSEFDIEITTDEPFFRYNTSPGSIEQEAQVTAVMDLGRGVGPGVRLHNSTTKDGYGIHVDTGGGAINIIREVAGVRTNISSPAIAIAAGDFATFRLSAEGVNGANVDLSVWYTDHNSTTKPSDPAAFIGTVASPDATYTDTDVTRLDDASIHLHGGICGRSGATDYDTRHCYFRTQAISDRSGGNIAKVASHLNKMMND